MHEHHSVAGVPGQDPTLPDVSLLIGGKERHLVFDFNAICVAEKVSGVNLLKAAVSEINATNIRGLLYAALLRDDPKLTLDEVGSWSSFKNLANVHTAITTAWFASIDEQKDEQPGEAPAQA